jgi:charged multivesicular body protein 4
MYESEIEKLQGARVTLEQQAMGLEGAAVNVEVFKAVESGVNASKNNTLLIGLIHMYYCL